MSRSISESLLSLFRGKTSADELLKSTKIIKQIFIGLCFLDNKNPNSIARLIFGNIVCHASLFFCMGQKNSKTGVIVQYGKYKYIDKETLTDKNAIDLLKNVDNIGFPYKTKGGLIFGELEYNTYKKEYCTIAYIKPNFFKSITLSKFLEEVTKDHIWDYDSYEFRNHNCQHFAAEAVKVLNLKYNAINIEIFDNSKIEGEEDDAAIPSVILKQLKENN